MSFEEEYIKLAEECKDIVKSIASKYKGQGLTFDELVCSGNIGVFMAMKTFDKNVGVKFSTHAYHYIQDEIEKNIDELSGLSKYKNQRIRNFKKAENELLQELKHKPSDKELSDKLEIPLEKIQELRELSQQNVSLDSEVDDESDAIVSDFISDESMNPEEQMIYEEEQKDSQLIKEALLKNFSLQERIVYYLKFRKDMRPKDIAENFNVSSNRIYTIIKQIKQKRDSFYTSEEYYKITDGKTDNLLKKIIEEQYNNIKLSKVEEKNSIYEKYDDLSEINFKELAKRFNDEYSINRKFPTFGEFFTTICDKKGINETNFKRATGLSESQFKNYKKPDAKPSISAIVSLGIYFRLGSHTVNGLLETIGYNFKKNDRTHLAYTFVLEQLKGYPIEYCNKVLELLGVEEDKLLNRPKKGNRVKK